MNVLNAVVFSMALAAGCGHNIQTANQRQPRADQPRAGQPRAVPTVVQYRPTSFTTTTVARDQTASSSPIARNEAPASPKRERRWIPEPLPSGTGRW
ncbi:MAG: hypothetical protein H6707_03650 [Deltaproteobacteria bacterium]|nr:hypothetical protein [Deltaproteobacteria bacterium]